MVNKLNLDFNFLKNVRFITDADITVTWIVCHSCHSVRLLLTLDYVLCKEMFVLCIVLCNLHWGILCNAMSCSVEYCALPCHHSLYSPCLVCILYEKQGVSFSFVRTLNSTSHFNWLFLLLHCTLSRHSKHKTVFWQCCVLTLLVSVVLKC